MKLTPQLYCLKPGKVNGTARSETEKCPWDALRGKPAAPGEGWAQHEPPGSPHSPLGAPAGSWLGLESANPPLSPGFISILPGEGGSRVEEEIGLISDDGRGEHHSVQNYLYPRFIYVPSQGHGIQ